MALTLLSGCAPSYRIENQAHAICMGIDYEEGAMTVTVQVPAFGSGSDDKQEKAGSSYRIFSARADRFENAYNILQATLPQQLNLTHLKSVVFSRAFAESDMFLETVKTFMKIFLVTGSAQVIVTEKSARLLIENQKPHIGIRLSITIPSMLSYHAQNGYIPSQTLSDLYAGLFGGGKTALAALSDTADGNLSNEKQNSYTAGSMNREGENKNEYMGAALFDRTHLAGTLNGREMQLVHFLSGEDTRIADFTEPAAMRLSSRKKPGITVDRTDDSLSVQVSLYLDAAFLHENEDMENVKRILEEDFTEVIRKCQKMKTEPFGFAETAVKTFSTAREWTDYNWLERFSGAHVTVNLELNAEK